MFSQFLIFLHFKGILILPLCLGCAALFLLIRLGPYFQFPVISSSFPGKELWKNYVGQVHLLVLHHSCICIKLAWAFS